jgi:hypothetical protein
MNFCSAICATNWFDYPNWKKGHLILVCGFYISCGVTTGNIKLISPNMHHSGEWWAGWGMWHIGGEEKWMWGFSGETWRKEIKRTQLKLIVNEYDGSAWNGLIWLRTGTSIRLFRTEWWPFRIYKMWGMTWPTQALLASQEWLCFRKLVSVEY